MASSFKGCKTYVSSNEYLFVFYLVSSFLKNNILANYEIPLQADWLVDNWMYMGRTQTKNSIKKNIPEQ
jgi:hypothetical protein